METGFLLLDKARGSRSTACVNVLRKHLGRRVKVGHAGTLDSTAEGLLVLLFGRMTRASQYVMCLPKTYDVTALLGMETDTLDSEGSPVATSGVTRVSEKEIRRTLAAFLGWTYQRPPRISAVHIGGKRAHCLAREGKPVDLPARAVYISHIRFYEYDCESGTIRFNVKCGKGTYVRSIVRDLGRMLGTFASVLKLKRTAIGPFSVSEAMKAEDLEDGCIQKNLKGPEILADAFPHYIVPPESSELLRNGNALGPEQLERKNWGGHEDTGIIVLQAKGVFSFAKCVRTAGKTMLKPETNILIGEGRRRDP
ncbi:MAG: tRNA pseudouridine(55) synthase TruB [Thermovirgaceae bacterium]